MNIERSIRFGQGRKRMRNRRKDRRVFSKTARKMRPLNVTMRGGTAL